MVGTLAWSGPALLAAPFTDHFDALTADLQSRASLVSNSTDKVEQGQFKAIQKVLSTLNGKDSTSLSTDIKNLGKISKTLVKSFPADFSPPTGSLVTNLQAVLDGLAGDVRAILDATQTSLNALPSSSCKDKANSALEAAESLLDNAEAATDFATATKLLGSALKAGDKTGKAVVKCASSGGGGGGGGDFLTAQVTGTINGSINTQYPSAVYSVPLDYYQIGAGDPNGLGLAMIVYHVTTNGTYSLGQSSDLIRTSPSATFIGAAGTITFTTVDLPNQKLAGSFSYTAPEVDPSNTGSVTVTGSFNISSIITINPVAK
jgi:hypothetical protein